MENISKHISYKEATRSSKAKKNGIENKPTLFQLQNMKMVAEKCFEPARIFYKKPMFISSFLRGKALNAITKGASLTSQHCQGESTKIEEGAIDIDMDVFDNGWTNNDLFNWFKDPINGIEFDQLIFEYPDKNGKASWVHISYRKGANRRMLLVAHVIDGKTKYSSYNDWKNK